MKKFINFINYILFSIVYWQACRKAQSLHRRNGARYFVIPCDWRMVVCNRKEYRKLLRDGRAEGKFNLIKRDSFYFTADRGGYTDLNPRRVELKRRMAFRHFCRHSPIH